MTLPIEEALPRLRAALAAHPAVVLQAPPGAGKTTLVPLVLLEEAWLKGKSIVMLEPRRLAARAAAGRMSQLRNETVGAMVGYRIRFESKVSKTTRIEVLTEGILTRRLQNDPALEGVGLVIFDEFHERHLHADLALALCLDSQRGLREDLKILVMSATLDGAAVSRLLNDAPIINSEGRSYPVDVQYLARDPEGRLPITVAAAVQRALEEQPGDALVFLPGAREIRKTQEQLEPVLGNATEVLPLYGDLPWESQQRAILPGTGRRRVVLATPIAETSLTIEGVRIIVDAGFARVPQFDPVSGLTRLVTQRISRASAEQRAGRAGRTAPGVCYRLWSETTQRGLIPQAMPEIKGADLAPLALELAAWGVQDATALAWLDPPPAASLAQARELLTELDALDAAGRITATGKALAQLPLHPRLAHMLRVAETMQRGTLACDIAALLSERDIFKGEARRSCDLAERVEALQEFRRAGRKAVQARGVDASACQRIEQAARQWRRLIRAREDEATSVDPDEIGLLLALAYPDRIAMQRTPHDAHGRASAAGGRTPGAAEPRYQLANGRGARLPEWELRLRQPFLVAANMDAAQGSASAAGGRMPGAAAGASGEGIIYLAASIKPDVLLQHFAAHIKKEDEVRWDADQQAVVARRIERLGALMLDSAPLKKAEPSKLRAAMLDGVRRLGLDALPWSDETRQWQARVLSMRQWFPEENWPDVSEAVLTDTIEDWLAPFLHGITRRDHLTRLDLTGIVKARLDWKQAQQLDVEAPTHIEVPSGSRLKLDYKPGESPVLAVKLQEMFGLADTPRIARGRVPVTLQLLSPARRPIQVTQDLKGFWERTYPEVKKELKGRYPKHPWPDDPWNAAPTARAKRRT